MGQYHSGYWRDYYKPYTEMGHYTEQQIGEVETMAGYVQVTIGPDEQMPTLKALARAVCRTQSECLKGTQSYRIDGKCGCFHCVPLTLEEACIRYLAGVDKDACIVTGEESSTTVPQQKRWAWMLLPSGACEAYEIDTRYDTHVSS